LTYLLAPRQNGIGDVVELVIGEDLGHGCRRQAPAHLGRAGLIADIPNV
jgi:hypothetical protein